MVFNTPETSLTERKVIRRGLLAGLAGLGAAALLKVTGAEKAEATDNFAIIIGDEIQTAQSPTRLTANQVFGGSILQVTIAGATLISTSGAIAGSSSSGYGVAGSSSSSFGVEGSSGSSAGVYGSSLNGTGVMGLSIGGSTGGHGVYGFSINGYGMVGTSTSNKGVFGQSNSGDGVHGTSVSGVGLRGTSQGNVGLVGISDTSIGLYGYNQIAGTPAFYAENLAPSGNRIAGYFNGHVQVQGNFTVLPGYAKNAAVTMPDGTDAVVYCQESPEPFFEDFGRAQLVGGVAQVPLEREFASMVKRDDYMVFPVPEGESKGWLYVSRKDANGFEVREAGVGKSNIPFSYRVVAKRKDIEGKRLARLDPAIKANIAAMRSSAASKSHPSVKAPRGGHPLVPLESLPEVPDPRPRR